MYKQKPDWLRIRVQEIAGMQKLKISLEDYHLIRYAKRLTVLTEWSVLTERLQHS